MTDIYRISPLHTAGDIQFKTADIVLRLRPRFANLFKRNNFLKENLETSKLSELVRYSQSTGSSQYLLEGKIIEQTLRAGSCWWRIVAEAQTFNTGDFPLCICRSLLY